MFSMAIMAGLVGWGVPAFRDMERNAARNGELNLFLQAIYLARSEAIKRGRVVILCRTDDPLAASPACASGSDWAGGWVIRQGDQPIRVQPAYANSGGIVASGIATLQFLPTGSVVGVGGDFTFRPHLAAADASYERLSRRICLNTQGVTRDC